MHLKWFRGERLDAVMRDVRDALGPDAVIMHTKTERVAGVRGILSRPTVAVLAGVDVAEPPAGAATAGVTPRRVPSPASAGRAAAPPPARPPRATPSGAHDGSAVDGLRADIAAVGRLLARVEGARALPPALAAYWERLTDAGLSAGLALRVLETAAPTPDGVEDAIAAALPRVERSSPADAAHVLVGPPGSGKSAVAAKLAVRARLDGGAAYVVSTDGTTLGVRAHWAAITSASGVPHAIALTPDAVRSARTAAPPGATLVVDTPGITAHDREGLAALAASVDAVAPADVTLVLSATTKTDDALAAAEAFRHLAPSQLVFTRLDETASIGSVVEIAVALGWPVGWIGTGRDIPFDIEPAAPRALARRLLGVRERGVSSA